MSSNGNPRTRARRRLRIAVSSALVGSLLGMTGAAAQAPPLDPAKEKERQKQRLQGQQPGSQPRGQPGGVPGGGPRGAPPPQAGHSNPQPGSRQVVPPPRPQGDPLRRQATPTPVPPPRPSGPPVQRSGADPRGGADPRARTNQPPPGFDPGRAAIRNNPPGPPISRGTPPPVAGTPPNVGTPPGRPIVPGDGRSRAGQAGNAGQPGNAGRGGTAGQAGTAGQTGGQAGSAAFKRQGAPNAASTGPAGAPVLQQGGGQRGQRAGRPGAPTDQGAAGPAGIPAATGQSATGLPSPTGRPGIPPSTGFLPPPGQAAPRLPGQPPGAPLAQPRAGFIPPGGPGVPPPAVNAQGPRNIDQVRQGRVRTEGPGGQTVIQEPGNRTIVRQNDRVFVTRNETNVVQSFVPGARSQRRQDGVTETVFVRRDGARVVTEVDGSGRLMRRFRRDPGGREITLVDNRRFLRNVAIGVGAAALATAVIVSLPRPSHALPREKYVVDYVSASDDDVYEALTAPPVERLERSYSLDEIRYSSSLRDRVRRVDLDNITFETGSFEITPEQFGKLERIARGISRAIEANPAEVFLIEGHTDAVGPNEDNASLSDRRAEAVARVLVEHFGVPVENLVTQGYGEQYLKVPTEGPERANRRVAVRRITPLLSQQE
ncbi:MAG: OmpA family protein [Hyphomicrobiaceae bacterium]